MKKNVCLTFFVFLHLVLKRSLVDDDVGSHFRIPRGDGMAQLIFSFFIWWVTGLVNSNPLCWLFTVKDLCKKWIFIQQTHRVLLPLFLTVPVPAHLLCNSGSNSRGTVQGPWRALCQLKEPLKGPRWRRGRCWEERKRKVLSQREIIDLPSKKNYDISQKGNRE